MKSPNRNQYHYRKPRTNTAIPALWKPILNRIYMRTLLAKALTSIPSSVAVGTLMAILARIVRHMVRSTQYSGHPRQLNTIPAVLVPWLEFLGTPVGLVTVAGALLIVSVSSAAVTGVPKRKGPAYVQRIDRCGMFRRQVEVAYELAREDGLSQRVDEWTQTADGRIVAERGWTQTADGRFQPENTKTARASQLSPLGAAIRDTGFQKAAGLSPADVIPLKLSVRRWSIAVCLVVGFATILVWGLPPLGSAEERNTEMTGMVGYNREDRSFATPETVEDRIGQEQVASSAESDEPLSEAGEAWRGTDQDDISEPIEDLRDPGQSESSGKYPGEQGEERTITDERTLPGSATTDGGVPFFDRPGEQFATDTDANRSAGNGAPDEAASGAPSPVSTEDLQTMLNQLNQDQINELFDRLAAKGSEEAGSEAQGEDQTGAERPGQEGETESAIALRTPASDDGQRQQAESNGSGSMPGLGAGDRAPQMAEDSSEENLPDEDGPDADAPTADRIEQDPLRLRRSQAERKTDQQETVRLAFRTDPAGTEETGSASLERPGQLASAVDAPALERTVVLSTALPLRDRQLVARYAQYLTEYLNRQRSRETNDQ